MNATGNLNLSGKDVNISGMNVNLAASGVLDLKGTHILLNGPGMPAARVGDLVGGDPLKILLGSFSVFIGN